MAYKHKLTKDHIEIAGIPENHITHEILQEVNAELQGIRKSTTIDDEDSFQEAVNKAVELAFPLWVYFDND